MGELDEEIMKHAMEKFNLPRNEIQLGLDDMVTLGLLEKTLDNYRLTKSGIRYVEDVILKGKKS